MMRSVVGLDPSLTGFGIAVVVGHLDPITATLTSTGRRGDDLVTRAGRLRALVDDVLHYVPSGALVVIEGPAFSRSNAGTWERAWLWGKVVDRLLAGEHPVVICPPSSRARYATGRGNAAKDHVLAAVVRRYPHVEVEGNDQADALVLAAMGKRLLGDPIEDNLPKTHLDAMRGLEVPYPIEGAA